MTGTDLRPRGMAKSNDCELCKEFESVKHHLMFECIVSRIPCDDVIEVFDINIISFEFIASNWLCKTVMRYSCTLM
jgi:hypothetical protein